MACFSWENEGLLKNNVGNRTKNGAMPVVTLQITGEIDLLGTERLPYFQFPPARAGLVEDAVEEQPIAGPSRLPLIGGAGGVGHAVLVERAGRDVGKCEGWAKMTADAKDHHRHGSTARRPDPRA